MRLWLAMLRAGWGLVSEIFAWGNFDELVERDLRGELRMGLGVVATEHRQECLCYRSVH